MALAIRRSGEGEVTPELIIAAPPYFNSNPVHFARKA